METPRWFDEVREKPPSRTNFDYVPHLSLQERNRRWEELRRRMILRGIDCLIFYGNDVSWGRGMANFRYITHCASAFGGWAVFPLEGEPVVFTGAPHLHVPHSIYLSLQDWVQDIRPDNGVGAVSDYIKQKGLDRGRIGIIAYGTPNTTHTLPYNGYVSLTQRLPNASFSDETGIINEMRMIKSSEEINFLEKACLIARKKIDTMIEATHPGGTEAEIWIRMIATDILNGGEPQTFNLLTSDNVIEEDKGYKHLLHGSEQPGAPTMRPIRKGDLVITEFHTVYCGYMAATEFSVFVGDPPRELVEIHKACIESLHAAEKIMKPGSTMRQVWEAMREPADRRGFDFVELGYHAHGLGSPEFPGVVYRPGDHRSSGKYIGDMHLQENMVLGTNIDVHNPKWRKDVGLQLGDTFHITSNGSRRMVNIPTDFACIKV